MGAHKNQAGEPKPLHEYATEKDIDHVQVDVREVDQHVTPLLYAYDLGDNKWDRYTLKDVYTPGARLLFNFDVSVGKLGRLLVLDNYGDEVMPDKFRRKLLTTKMFAETIGIFRKTGEVVRVAFIREKVASNSEEFYSIVFYPFFDWDGSGRGLLLPKSYLKRLDELKSKKRPFCITLRDTDLFQFSERWVGYESLQNQLLVDLHFDELRLQVWSHSYREVSAWKDTGRSDP
jgi:hypothetical protein